MSGASLIPVDAPGDHEDVADLLSIARVTWNRGDHEAAVSFVQRAAQTAMELESEIRGIELAKIAAELKATVSQPPAAAPPPAGASPSTAARAHYASATATPQLILTPARPPHQTLPGIDEADGRAALQPPAPELMEDEPPTVPYPSALPLTPEQMLSADDVQDAPRDTNADPPPAHSQSAPVKAATMTGSPRPPTVGMSQAPRPAAGAYAPAGANRGPSAPPPGRTSGQPPPLPSGRPGAAPTRSVSRPPGAAPAPSASKPPGTGPIPSSVAHAAARFASSPIPPKVASARPPAAASAGSRAPTPLRVKSVDEPRVHENPPPMVSGSAEPSAVRRSYPGIDEIVAPVTAAGGAPVVVGVRARIHFNTDGSLELGPDTEGATGLAVIVLPQRGEDMTTILKRLAARKR